MDEILQRFENTLACGRIEDNSSHKDLYKNCGKYGNQEERRIAILQQQKSNRENKVDINRGIYNLVDHIIQMECTDKKNSVFTESSQATYVPRVNVPGFTHNYYKKILMHSEWMVEKPEDFSTKWFVAPCPMGTRVLVIAYNGKTRLYTKYGQFIDTINSRLPGGYGKDKLKYSSVLDGFYCKEIKTIFVLDVLFWRHHVMTDGEMEFRRYWLEGKFSENPEYGIINSRNKVCFKLLPMVPCDMTSLQNFMNTYPLLEDVKIDGLLFYHKHGSYISGQTPLVGWLYPYMVPEVLCPGMAIHELYAAEKPKDYINQAIFIKTFEEKYVKKMRRWKKKNRKRSVTSMEVEDIPAAQQVDINATYQNGNAENEVYLEADDQNGASQVPISQNGMNETVDTQYGGNQATICQNEVIKTLIHKEAILALMYPDGGNSEVPKVIPPESFFSYIEPTQRQVPFTEGYDWFNYYY